MEILFIEQAVSHRANIILTDSQRIIGSWLWVIDKSYHQFDNQKS